MSRYTCSYLIDLSTETLDNLYDELTRLSLFEVMHRRSDILVLLETPGDVFFSQLVTIELFVHPSTGFKHQVDLLVKNHELPLRANNRCRRYFELIHGIITEVYGGISLAKVIA